MRPKPQNTADPADHLDDALEALWRGDSLPLDDLFSQRGVSGRGLGGMLRGAIRECTGLAAEPPGKPEVVGHEILERIGEGGMGVVYKARQLSTKRDVALKVMLPGLLASSSATQRFQREIELTARLQHAGIVWVFEAGRTSNGDPYYTMDYVPGTRMNDWLADAKPDVPATLRLFQELCEAVEYAHRHGVVHRDLKPGNVLVDGENHPHILDFGLAKAIDAAGMEEGTMDGLSLPGMALGTLPYLAPEQVEQLEAIDGRADVYALGVMFFEALTGSWPYERRGSRSEITRRILEDPPLRPSSLSERVNRELETIVLKALEKDREQRYQSVAQFGQDVGRYLRNEPILAKRPTVVYRVRKKLAKHRERTVLATMTAVLALTMLAIGVYWRRASIQEVLRVRYESLAMRARWDAGTPDSEILGSPRALLARYPEIPEVRLNHACFEFARRHRLRDNQLMSNALAVLKEGLQLDPSQGAFAALWDEMCNLVDTPLSLCNNRPEPDRYDPPGTADEHYIWSFATLDPEKAAEHARRAVECDGEHALAWGRLYYHYEDAKEYGEARNAAEKLAALEDNPGAWLYKQAIICTRLGDYETADILFGEAFAAARSRGYSLGPEGWRRRALPHFCLGDYTQAVTYYEKAMDEALLEQSIWPRYFRAACLWMLGKKEEAADGYRQFLSVKRDHLYASARLYLVLRDQERSFHEEHEALEAQKVREEAENVLTSARALAPPESWIEAILDCLGGDITPDDLIARIDQTNKEQVCEGYYYAGAACLLQDKRDEAREWFRKCVETNLPLDPDKWPPDPMNEYHLGKWRLQSL